ncbi:hypothetical protein FRC17_006926 [Serendipita sp. 399]|nr:hypothetical protein FRC17_006926 [Serendipita sp. 399]
MLHTLPHSAKPREHLQTEEPVTKKEKLASSTANIPRLVSVTEIIKREFATLVAANKGGPHNPPGALLYQYNMVGTLPDHRMESAEEVDPMVVLQALEGKSHYQASPPPPKKSRSSRARAKKRLEKEKAAQKVE